MTRYASALIITVLLSGCAGQRMQSLPASTTSAPLAVRLEIPSATTTASSGRRPLYVSRATKGLGISYGASPATFPTITTPTIAADVSASSSLCVVNSDGSRACSISIAAPTGTVDFQVTAWDAVPVSGSFSGSHRLSGTTVTKTITAGQVNSLSFTLNGVVNAIAVFVSPSALIANGTTQTSSVSVNATDAAGNIIISDNYADAGGNPLTITLSDSDGSGATHLSQSTLTAPTTGITLSYSGGGITDPTISASATGITTAATKVRVSPTLTNVSPGYRSAGTTTSVTLTGTNFTSGGTAITVSGGSISVNTVNVTSSTSLTANFVLPSGASIGNQTVTVTTSDGTSGAKTFAVAAIIFVTSATYDGILSGLVGADADCQIRAATAGLPGTYRCWLSSSTVNAGDRMTHSDGPYVRTDGALVANNFTDLTSGSIRNVLRDEFGVAVGSGNFAWTNTLSNGTEGGILDCVEWNSNAVGQLGTVGDPGNQTNANWTLFTDKSCSVVARLIGVQQ